MRRLYGITRKAVISLPFNFKGKVTALLVPNCRPIRGNRQCQDTKFGFIIQC